MIVPMDSTPDLSSTERVQRLYNKNVELENRRRKAAQARIPSDPNAWQKMRENYEAIVLEDHAFSEQHDIEYALWQLHYRRIEELRAHFTAALTSAGSTATQNGKGPTRHGPDRITKIRSQFKTLLSEATGFYHDLMVKIRAKFGLPLGYISDDSESQILSKEGNKSAEVKKGLLSCHRCLIYLGDLARYKGLYGEGDSKARDFAAASSYYMQASSLWPSSGNSHHQLAILASYSGDELVAVYRYFRSLAVDNPFSTARDNLIIAFEKNRQSYSQLLGDVKASSVKTAPVRMTGKGRGKGEARVHLKDARVEASLPKDKASSIPGTLKAFSIRFVRLNGILFTRTSMETFGEIFSMAKSDLLELLSSGPDEEYTFGSDVSECRLLVIRMIAILVFTVHNMKREAENQSYAEILQRSIFLQNAFTAIFEFMGHILERCTQLTDPSNSYLLPGIMVFVEWLACRPDIAVGSDVEEKQASARSFFWSHCISFMNKLLSSGLIYNKEDEDEDEDETCFFNMSRYDESETSNRVALSEDFELRGFVPLLPAQLILDFSRKLSFGSDGGNKEKKFRVQRIIAAGKALATVIRGGQQVIYFNPKSKRFAICAEPQMSDDFSLSSSSEVPTLNVTVQENFVKNQLYMGGEEEDDEVIVFKPSVIEKNADAIASTLTSSELGSHFGPFSAPPNGFLQQTALSSSLIPPTSLANITAQYIQPIQPSTSKWLVDQQSSIANGLTNLSILDNNGLPGKPESFNLTSGSKYHVPFPETTIPSKFGSITSSGGVIGSLSMNPPSIMPMGLRKNPVSRPVRHLGPPPGFSSVPPKFLDESLSGIPMKNENPPMDDYSWLDGYQFPSSTHGIGFNNSIGHKSNSSMGMVSFPFPGKQDPMVQGQVENQKGLPGYQFPEHLNIYHSKQQKGNQPSDALPVYQGQSLWEGRFFV